MIANDCTIDFQSKSADYYQSSFVVLRRELDFATSRFYIFNRLKSAIKIPFLIPVVYLQLKTVFNFRIHVLLDLQQLLFQKLSSFIKQSVFVNETIHSCNFKTSLYNA